MANRANSLAGQYAEAMFARARTPVEPPGFHADFTDQPARFKTYPDAVRVPLPVWTPERIAPLGDLLWPARETPTASPGEDALTRIGAFLRLSYGLLDRRFDVTWNNDSLGRTRYPNAVWGRGTTSGGGLYPLEIYWCAGPSGPLLPGAYHYAVGHHSLARLAVGDLTRRVRATAMGHPAADDTDQFLVVAARFWRNSFKYHNFCYQVVTQDVGALLGTWHLLGAGMGLGIDPLLWFRDEELNQTLGLRTADESAFALVPLRLGDGLGDGARRTDRDRRCRAARVGAPVVTRTAPERSRVVRHFELVDAVHASALIDNEPRPDPTAGLAAADGDGEPGTTLLPAAIPSGPDLVLAIRHRRSSFGRFTGRPPLTLSELATLLSATAAVRNFRADHQDACGASAWTSLLLLTNRVEGLADGRYGYEFASHSLTPLADPPGQPVEPMAVILQRHYLLRNYDMGQVGAVVAIVGRPAAAIEAYGNRGLRLLNAEVGVAAQAAYLAAAALGIGCGAVLGFDNVAMNETLGLGGSDRRTLLFMLFGHDRPTSAAIDAGLVWPTAGTGTDGRSAA